MVKQEDDSGKIPEKTLEQEEQEREITLKMNELIARADSINPFRENQERQPFGDNEDEKRETLEKEMHSFLNEITDKGEKEPERLTPDELVAMNKMKANFLKANPKVKAEIKERDSREYKDREPREDWHNTSIVSPEFRSDKWQEFADTSSPEDRELAKKAVRVETFEEFQDKWEAINLGVGYVNGEF